MTTATGNQDVKPLDVQKKAYKPKQQIGVATPSCNQKSNTLIKTQVIKNTRAVKQSFKLSLAKLVNQKVEEIPDGLATDEYKVEAKKIVCFHGKDHFLSTLYPATFVIGDNTYLSVEHYYQACKLFSLAGPEHAIKLKHIVQPIRVKTTAKKILHDLKVSNAAVEKWKVTDGFSMLQHAINYKFAQNPELSKKLLETGDAILAQAYDRDTFYACGADKEGVEQWAVNNDRRSIKIPSELTLANVKHIPLVGGQGRNIVGVICMNIRKAMSDLSLNKTYEKADSHPEVADDSKLPAIMDSLSLHNDNRAKNKDA